MFTGLVQQTGVLRGLRASGESRELEIAMDRFPDDILVGESLAVDGCCLTVTRFASPLVWLDVSFETLARTTLGSSVSGRLFNLERALRLCDRLGGHLVSGHVDDTGVVLSALRRGEYLEITIQFPPAVSRYIAPKGSIAIDGVSLTVNAVGKDKFSVAIIPHTVSETTISSWTSGRKVNLEVDIISRYVEQMLGKEDQSKGLEAWLGGADYDGGLR
jgi:riboflavin synthase